MHASKWCISTALLRARKRRGCAASTRSCPNRSPCSGRSRSMWNSTRAIARSRAPTATGSSIAGCARRSHESGADVRARGLVSGTHRVRREVGPATVRTRIKICGITRTEDARAAAQAGADAIGLVLYPSSPRYLSVERAVEIRDALPPFVQTVALFVNPDAAQVAQVI